MSFALRPAMSCTTVSTLAAALRPSAISVSQDVLCMQDGQSTPHSHMFSLEIQA
jgi:hypothetical protein